MTFFNPFAKAAQGIAPLIDAIVSGTSGYSREEAAVWKLFVNSEPQWSAALSTRFNGPVYAQYGAVFCHQKPKVTFATSTQPCLQRELGDALVVISFLDPPKKARRAALLLQAKRMQHTPGFPSSAVKLAASEPGQWELYTRWPPFTHGLDSTGQLPKKFGTNALPLSRARHLLLRESQQQLVDAWTAVPVPSPAAAFSNQLTLGSAIEHSLGGRVAQRVAWELDPKALQAAGKSDWSIVVASICDHVATHKVGKHASRTTPESPRGARMPFSSTVSGATASNADAPEAPGFSLISLVLSTASADLDQAQAQVLGA